MSTNLFLPPQRSQTPQTSENLNMAERKKLTDCRPHILLFKTPDQSHSTPNPDLAFVESGSKHSLSPWVKQSLTNAPDLDAQLYVEAVLKVSVEGKKQLGCCLVLAGSRQFALQRFQGACESGSDHYLGVSEMIYINLQNNVTSYQAVVHRHVGPE